MCDEPGSADEALTATPREAPGPAVDPIALRPVDSVEITTLIDNYFDALLAAGEGVRRPGMGSGGTVRAPQFEGGTTTPGLVLELIVLVLANLAATVLRFLLLRGWVFNPRRQAVSQKEH